MSAFLRKRDYEAARLSDHAGHGWMMMACCIPLIVIAIALAATGVVGFGVIFAAIMCVAMMAMMMRMMSSGGDER